jgi:hypothetical protein
MLDSHPRLGHGASNIRKRLPWFGSATTKREVVVVDRGQVVRRSPFDIGLPGNEPCFRKLSLDLVGGDTPEARDGPQRDHVRQISRGGTGQEPLRGAACVRLSLEGVVLVGPPELRGELGEVMLAQERT